MRPRRPSWLRRARPKLSSGSIPTWKCRRKSARLAPKLLPPDDAALIYAGLPPILADDMVTFCGNRTRGAEPAGVRDRARGPARPGSTDDFPAKWPSRFPWPLRLRHPAAISSNDPFVIKSILPIERQHPAMATGSGTTMPRPRRASLSSPSILTRGSSAPFATGTKSAPAVAAARHAAPPDPASAPSRS